MEESGGPEENVWFGGCRRLSDRLQHWRDYALQVVRVQQVLPHAEYDKGDWKE